MCPLLQNVTQVTVIFLKEAKMRQTSTKENQEAVKFYTLAARRISGLSCYDFGSPLGVDRQWVNNWERNGAMPLPTTLWRVFKKDLGEPYFSWAVALLKLQGIDLEDVVGYVREGSFRSSGIEYHGEEAKA
jgi:transcriptional regulator with XRE-family HTH domain